MQLDDHFIRFKFFSASSMGKDRPFEVYANTMDEMNMFLNQHCFKGVDENAFAIIPKNICRNKNDMILELYSFKSNHSNDIYHVMTTRFFVDMAMENTATDVNFNLLFGEAILRSDIEIFKHINTLLWKLPHVHVKDVLIADDNMIDDNIIKESLDIRKEYRLINRPWDDLDSQMVIESLYDVMSSDPIEVNPITIEAYVSSFTTLITDVCNT